MPWALELYFLCQQYNRLPTATAILDEDPYLLVAMDNSITGYRFADKKLKDYQPEDHELKRLVEVATMLMNGASGERLIARIKQMCGASSFDENNKPDIDRLMKMGLGSCITEICQHIA